MIHISEIAKRIETFLIEMGEKKFKIFLRLNFSIDVYIASERD